MQHTNSQQASQFHSVTDDFSYTISFESDPVKVKSTLSLFCGNLGESSINVRLPKADAGKLLGASRSGLTPAQFSKDVK